MGGTGSEGKTELSQKTEAKRLYDKMLNLVAVARHRKQRPVYEDSLTFRKGTPRGENIYVFDCFVLPLEVISGYHYNFFCNLKLCLDQMPPEARGISFSLILFPGQSHWIVLNFKITDDFKLKLFLIDALDYTRVKKDRSERENYLNIAMPSIVIDFLVQNGIEAKYFKDFFIWYPRMQITGIGCDLFALDLALQLQKIARTQDIYLELERIKCLITPREDKNTRINYYIQDNCTSIQIPPALLRMHQNFEELSKILDEQSLVYPGFRDIQVSHKRDNRRTIAGYPMQQRIGESERIRNTALLNHKALRLQEKLKHISSDELAKYYKEIEFGDKFFERLGVKEFQPPPPAPPPPPRQCTLNDGTPFTISVVRPPDE